MPDAYETALLLARKTGRAMHPSRQEQAGLKSWRPQSLYNTGSGRTQREDNVGTAALGCPTDSKSRMRRKSAIRTDVANTLNC